MEFQIFTAPDTASPCAPLLGAGHDSRDGLDLILFGLEACEEHRLVDEISALIGFDLSFIRFPDSALYDSANPVAVADFLRDLRSLRAALDDSGEFHHKLTYPHLDSVRRAYFAAHGFRTDISALIDYCECCVTHGARVVWIVPDGH